jgi:hypothetical protein
MENLGSSEDQVFHVDGGSIRLWTADRLLKRGMDHPEKCPLCDQEQETCDHLLIGCVFAREFWFKLLSQVISKAWPHS